MKVRLIMSVAAFVFMALAPDARPEDVFAPNPTVAVFEGPDYSGKNDEKCVVRIVGARNGIFTGQAVVFSKAPAKDAAAQVSDLKLKDGGGTIPASAVQIFYAQPTGGERGAAQRFPGIKGLKRFDALFPAPQETPTQTHPVWLKVKVPADAKPGLYEGELFAAGRKVPVQLSVADWKLPDPAEFVTHVGLLQSLDSEALQYKAELWSDKHWEQVGKTLDLMAQVGNKVIVIPVICKTHFGNEQGMVRWIKDGDKYKFDLTPAEKYLDLYIKKVGKPKVVGFYVWERFCGANYLGGDKGSKGGPTPVTLLDPATGKTETFDGPVEGTPESEAFWKPVMDALHEMMAKRGLGDETFMIGVAGDARPNKDAVEMFKKVAPYARWFLHSHGKATSLSGVPVGYLSHVWGAGSAPDPDKPPKASYLKNYYYGWNQELQVTVFPREGGGGFVINPPLWGDAPLGVHRELAEASLAANLRGFGRVGADFWGVLGGKTLLNRYPESNLAQLSVSTATGAIFHPGPDGALSTVRFENLREGVQEAEAKIFIEKALVDKALRAKLGDENAKKYEELLKERVRVFRKSVPGGKDDPEHKNWEWFATESGWQDRTEALFAAAAEVAAKLK